jgi:hypothetical protein
LAVAALVLGLLCFVPALGLVLGIVALTQIRRRGERGRGMAIAGIVLSSLGTAALVLVLAAGGIQAFQQGWEEGARDTAGDGVTFSVDEGECFDVPGGSLEGETYDVDTVPCTGSHQAEVFANFRIPNGGYPGDDAVTRTAEDKCYALRYGYAMDVWALPDDVDLYYFTPTRESWRLGDRKVTCMFGNTDERSGLTGSLRRDRTTLTSGQFDYLSADIVLYRALDTVPDAEYVEDDLPGHRKWAGRVAAALDEETAMLRADSWPARAEQAVADQVTALEAARTEWGEAARATDVDTFYEHYDRGGSLLEGTAAVAARKALGLAAAPPDHASGGGSGDGGGNGSGDGDGGDTADREQV